MYSVSEMLGVEELLKRMLDAMKVSYGKLSYKSGCFLLNGMSEKDFAGISSGAQFFKAQFVKNGHVVILSIHVSEAKKKFVIMISSIRDRKAPEFDLDEWLPAFRCFASKIVDMEDMGLFINLFFGESGYLVRLFLCVENQKEISIRLMSIFIYYLSLMKFEIIFEDNGTYGAAIRIGKEGIFTVGKNQTELRKNIKEAVACACGSREKLTRNHYQLVKFLNIEKQLHAA